MSTHTPTPDARPPCCPRCGYDLSGETGRWHERCPISGICPECGADFAWGEVFAIRDEWGSEVDWYSEHAHGLFSMLRRTPGTLARLVFPSRFFRVVNHRRAVRLAMLTRWLVLVAVLLHLLVSPIGYIAHRVEGPSYDRRDLGALARFLHAQLTEIPSAIAYPFFFLFNGPEGYQVRASPLADYGVVDYMRPSYAMVGATLFWLGLIAFVRLTRYESGTDLRHEWRQLMRIVLLNVLAVIVYVQIVRLGFGLHIATGATVATNWVPYAIIMSVFALLFWQQLVWTHAVRSIWHIRRSFLINVGGCFGSVAFGIYFFFWML